ncbi:N-formylglutamate amidohydrolase [Caenispirillum salinarum]|uniref:N-formylglutamate amidohydrolase n=1 Tax=Caenispirillum salinarum TaxID=859058 RepID=UPI00384DAF57
MTDPQIHRLNRELPPLLGPNDPPAAHLVNGEGTTPLLLVCDHASNTIPESLGTMGLPDEALADHIAWDIGAAAVTQHLAEMLNAPAILCGYSRLVIDCNRQPGDPTSVPAVSDTWEVTANQNMDQAHFDRRLDEVFHPYHRAITNTLAHMWQRNPEHAPVVFAVHSFTPCMKSGEPRPWECGILWDRDPRLPDALLNHLRKAHPELTVGDNEPYDGREIAYTTDTHAAAAGLAHAAVEVRQDLIGDDAGAARWAGILADALRHALAREDIHKVVLY